MKYACPNCGQQLIYSKDNPFRPFCSERCKLIDLGEWASEGHKIGGSPAEDELLSEELESIFRVSKIDPQ